MPSTGIGAVPRRSEFEIGYVVASVGALGIGRMVPVDHCLRHLEIFRINLVERG